MHTIEEQVKGEGISVAVKQLLSQCTHVGNALITYNGASPVNALFGRHQALLPDLHVIPDDDEGRDLQRIREVFIQKIMESIATARINQAPRTVTTPAGQQLNFKPGELVDFWRPSGSKDKSGWQSRATVVENLPTEGHVKIQHKGNKDILVRYQDIRRHMEFAIFDLTPGSEKSSALQVAWTFLNSTPPKKLTALGYTDDGICQMMVACKKWPEVALA